MRLQGRVAIVTGGASGIGKGITHAFLQEGAKVAICDRNGEALDAATKELTAVGSEVLGIKADVSLSTEVKSLFKNVKSHFGILDILVNNAGIFRTDPKGIDDRARHLDLITMPVKKHSLQITRYMTDHDWENMIRTNLNSVFYCTREALNIMEDKGYGRIINISSVSGISSIASHSPNYSTSKGAIAAFTKSVAHEVAGAGVCVNCIAPGYIATSLFAKGIESMGAERKARFLQLVPVGRMGKVEEIAALAVYLASDDAAFMVGQIISPNGGMVI